MKDGTQFLRESDPGLPEFAAAYGCSARRYHKPGDVADQERAVHCGAGGSTKLIDHSTGKITRHFNYKFPYEYISRYEKMTAYKPQLEEFLSQL